MIVIVCLDDKGGMAFNNRRQSRDSLLCAKLVELSGNGRLLMNGYSAKLFKDQTVTVDEDFMEIAQKGDFCFVENTKLLPYYDKIEGVILFKWNKVYPSDVKLDISLDGMTLRETFDFAGSSHDKISCEVWKK